MFMERWNSQADGEIRSQDREENKDSYLFPFNTDAEREMPEELNPKHYLTVRTSSVSKVIMCESQDLKSDKTSKNNARVRLCKVCHIFCKRTKKALSTIYL